MFAVSVDLWTWFKVEENTFNLLFCFHFFFFLTESHIALPGLELVM